MFKRGASTMFWAGVSFLLIGIVMDDLSSMLLFRKGFLILETNPLFIQFGSPGWIIAMIMIYIAFIFAWRWLIEGYEESYKKKFVFHRKWDVFVFMGCVVIVTLATTKILLGVHNVTMLVGYTTDEIYREEIKEYIKEAESFKETHPEEFKNMMNAYYSDKITNINYFISLINTIIAYSLFRVGHRVEPWGSKQN